MTAGNKTHSFERLESRMLLSAGDLDSLFAGGKLTHDVMGGNDFGFAVSVQADGKVLVAGKGRSSLGTSNDFCVLRFNVDGTLDSTFGTGGRVLTDFGSSTDSANAMKLQADGKIVVAGQTSHTGTLSEFAVARYNMDGSLDTTFGAGGRIITDFSVSTDQAKAVTMQSDGRIVVAGQAIVSGITRIAIARYTTAGALDTSFDGDGKLTTIFTSGSASATSVHSLSDGSIVIAGYALNLSTDTRDFAAVKYTSGGAVDMTFGVNGWARIDMGGDLESAAAMLVQSDGKFILAGDSTDMSTGMSDFAMVRLMSNGSIDSTFGASGKVFTDFDGAADMASAAALQSDGKIVLAGLATVGGNSMFALARYDSTGALDSTFGGGMVTVSFGASDSANAVAIDGEGRIVSAGFTMSDTGAFDFAVARHIGKVNLAPVANAGGSYTVDLGGSVTFDGMASNDPDGSIVSYEWDFDYDGSTFDVNASGSTALFSSVGLSAQTRTIAVRVTDDGGLSHIATTTVTINPEPLPPPPPPPPPPPAESDMIKFQDDPAAAGKKILVFNGGSKNDHVKFTSAKGGKIEVRLNGKKLGAFANISRVIANGNAGHDMLDAFCVNVPVEFCGGAGNDMLVGSRLNDILTGGDGNDHLFGWAGNDLLVGGKGSDRMWSLFGNDMMVGGSLNCESDADTMRGMLKTGKLNSSSVIDDMACDAFHCTSARDAVFSGAGDKVNRPKKK